MAHHFVLSTCRLTLIPATLAAVNLLGASSDRLQAHPQHPQVGPTFSQSSDRLVAAAPVSSATVVIEGFQFKPSDLQLQKGGTVTFVNKDSAPHTATPAEGAQFTGTGRLVKDQSKAVVFDTVGIQNYFCEIHPSMKGKITVVP